MFRIAIVVAVASCGARWQPTSAQLAPMPALSPGVVTTVGPLAVEARPAETSWADTLKARRIAEDHYLDAPRIHAETTAFLALVDELYRPSPRENRLGFDEAHRLVPLLDQLAPYSAYSVTFAFGQSTARLHLCIESAGVMASCYQERAPRSPPASAFEIGEAAPGIAVLTIHDLTDANQPAWRDFSRAARPLASARGLIVDLRDAAGSDPRALLPWLAELTGRRELKPLRAIVRAASADRYIADYNARFADRGRDAAIWKDLVGPGSPTQVAATKPPAPIAILVGRHCHSACELVARTLAAYAGATVIGGVTHNGRLARDEPAMMVLPHSQTTIYFHATRYLLAADIEAATGPTDEWSALASDPVDEPSGTDRYPVADRMTFAIREVSYRIEHPEGWPRCDALPATAVGPKLRSASLIASAMCDRGYRILLLTDVPESALRRFLATCPVGVDVMQLFPGGFTLRLSAPTPELLARIAASELVGIIQVDCEPQYNLN